MDKTREEALHRLLIMKQSNCEKEKKTMQGLSCFVDPVDLLICREAIALIDEARERFRKEQKLCKKKGVE